MDVALVAEARLAYYSSGGIVHLVHLTSSRVMTQTPTQEYSDSLQPERNLLLQLLVLSFRIETRRRARAYHSA